MTRSVESPAPQSGSNLHESYPAWVSTEGRLFSVNDIQRPEPVSTIRPRNPMSSLLSPFRPIDGNSTPRELQRHLFRTNHAIHETISGLYHTFNVLLEAEHRKERSLNVALKIQIENKFVELEGLTDCVTERLRAIKERRLNGEVLWDVCGYGSGFEAQHRMIVWNLARLKDLVRLVSREYEKE